MVCTLYICDLLTNSWKPAVIDHMADMGSWNKLVSGLLTSSSSHCFGREINSAYGDTYGAVYLLHELPNRFCYLWFITS